MTKIVKNTTFPSLLDLIAPHSCLSCGHLGTVLCDRCKKHILAHHTHICPNCKEPLLSAKCPNCSELPPIYAIGPRHELLDHLIHTYKYESTRALAPILAELLNSVLPPDLPTNTLVVPLPTSTKHIRERGLDHTLLLAKHLARLRGWRVARPLIRTKNTVQVGSDRTTRLKQADNAYAPAKRFVIDPTATYLLLDDVWTTGASILAATKKLQLLGIANDHISVTLLAFSTIS